MLQYFMYLLILVWTMLFGIIFFKLFPDAADHIIYKRNTMMMDGMRDPGDIPCSSPQQPMPKQRPHAEEEFDDQPTDKQLKSDIVPLNKDDPPIKLRIEDNEEMETSEYQVDVEKKMSSALENRLIQILVKMNLAACKECSKDDKRIILQLKMMKAFLDGKPKEALKYSDELNPNPECFNKKWSP